MISLLVKRTISLALFMSKAKPQLPANLSYPFKLVAEIFVLNHKPLLKGILDFKAMFVMKCCVRISLYRSLILSPVYQNSMLRFVEAPTSVREVYLAGTNL